MPELSLKFEVYCAACNAGLCNQTEATTTRHRLEPCIRVAPCERCLESAKDRANAEGFAKGYDEGLYDGANK